MRSAFVLLLTAAFIPNDLVANPLFAGADPHAAVFGKEYWIYPTEARSREPLFAAYSSRDLQKWERRGVVLKLSDVSWIKDDGAPRHYAWAPGIAAKDGKGYFYYSVGPQNPTPSRIGVAVGDRPEGPFQDIGKPLITGGDGFEAIDPMVFIDKDGTPYLYAGGSAGAKLRVWKLKPNMIELDEEIEVGTPPEFTEGAFMHERNGIYYLSYSHGRYNDSSYSVHYATAPSPTGPWEYRGRILESDARRKGPGHHAFIMNPTTKEWFIVYHRWETSEPNGPYRGQRQIAIDRVQYNADGTIKPIEMTSGNSPRSVIR
jgi:Beta-xylosidase